MSSPASGREISVTALAGSSRVPEKASSSEVQEKASSSRVQEKASSSRVQEKASSSRVADEASRPQDLASSRSSPQLPGAVRYVCTVSQSCRRTFDNYNNWAQHETNGHRDIDFLHEDDVRQRGSDTHVNKRSKVQRKPSSLEPAGALKESNAEQRSKAIKKADSLASTYDIWFCDGVDGCLDGWYKQADFEAHFKERHTMGWNKLPRTSRPSDYLLGPEHGVRMWCGFCHLIFEVSSKEKWYYDRLVHVASHFDRTCPDEVWTGDIYAWNFIEMH